MQFYAVKAVEGTWIALVNTPAEAQLLVEGGGYKWVDMPEEPYTINWGIPLTEPEPPTEPPIGPQET